MRRVVLMTVVFVLCVEALIILPFFLTPMGARVATAINPPPPTPTPTPTPSPTPLPVLTVQGTPPEIQSKAAYLLDADTGNVLVDVNGTEPLPIASTTKVMTALLTIEKGDLDQMVTVPQEAVDLIAAYEGASTARLVAGDQIRLHDLLYGLMLPSGNDAAIAVAHAVAGSTDNFVKMMNDRAKELKLDTMQFVNPHGLTPLKGEPGQINRSSAADLANLTLLAMKNPLFSQIVRMQRYVLQAGTTNHAYEWETTNHLLEQYPGTMGVKTGFAEEAGYCLTFAASDTKHNLIGVVLHDTADNPEQRFTDAGQLLEWGFNLPLLPPAQQTKKPAA